MLRLVAMWWDDNKTIERSPLSKKSSGPIEYLTSLRSNTDSSPLAKRWVSPDSFWPLLKLSVKGTIGKAIKQNYCRATQSSHPNQFLRKLTLYRYNKLSSYQVHGTYKLSWYHSTSIIKLRPLGTSTPLLYNVYLIGSLAAKRTPSHSCVGSAIRFEPSQPTKTSTRPETWGPTSPEILRCYVVKAPYVPEVIGTELKNNQAKRERYDSSLVIVDQLTMIATALHQ